ncbi:MAG: DegT/DnrJ/EryC1/StrS family aminotransferase [Syntrophales bacterium]|jgi:dTDP-4-amino-4,6-dideoxygalactose transaminase
MKDPARAKDNFLVFGSPIIEDDEIREVVASMKSGWLGTGPKVARFEEDFRKYKGAEYAVALNSCTAALHLSLLASGVRPGDEVITTAMTFCSTVNAIIHSGATPVLADIDRNTMNVDPEQIRTKITSRTRAILPVHFAGRPCDMDTICAIAEEYNLKIIEDCAHAIETESKGRKAGTFGDFGCFSFYVTKNIVTGEGGMVLAKREGDAALIKILGLHGMTKDAWKRFSDEGYKHYYVVGCGFKYNMMDLQAAIGIHQLQRVGSYWQRRREVWKKYNSAFAGLPIGLPAEPESGTRHAFHLYTILVDGDRAKISRDEFLDAMTKQNIGVGVHYLSIPEHPYYQEVFGWRPEEYPNAMAIGRQTVSLPISAKLKEEDIEDVVGAVRRVLHSH